MMILEAVLIYRGGQNVMNSRSQYSRCQVPRLSVMVGENQQFNTIELKQETEKLKKRIAEENHITPKNKRRKVDNNSNLIERGKSKDMKMTPFIKDSRESNSNLEEHKDNLENHDVYEGKRCPISSNILPPRSTKRRRKFKSSLEGQPPFPLILSQNKFSVFHPYQTKHRSEFYLIQSDNNNVELQIDIDC